MQGPLRLFVVDVCQDFVLLRGHAGYAGFQYTFASVMFTGLAAYLVYEYAPTARGSGIPEADLGFSPVL